MVSQKQKRGGERAVEKTRNGKVQKRLFHFAWKSRTQRGIPTFPQPRLLLFRKHKTTTTGILIVVHRKEWLTPDSAATRPIRAAFTSRLVATSIAQFAQWFLSALMGLPHPLQTCSGFGCLTSSTLLPFTSRLLRCVRRVAISCRAMLVVEVALDTQDQISWATYSATGATSLRQVSEVSQSLIASDDAIRQFPLRSSQKSERRRGSL